MGRACLRSELHPLHRPANGYDTAHIAGVGRKRLACSVDRRHRYHSDQPHDRKHSGAWLHRQTAASIADCGIHFLFLWAWLLGPIGALLSMPITVLLCWSSTAMKIPRWVAQIMGREA